MADGLVEMAWMSPTELVEQVLDVRRMADGEVPALRKRQ